MLITKWIRLTGALTVIIIFIIALVNTNSVPQYDKAVLDKKISNNHFVVCGRLLKITLGNSDSAGVEHFFCDYIYNNNIIEANKPCKPITVYKFDSGFHNIFIAVDKNNPKLNILLEDEEDYTRLKITREDTLGVKCIY